jgi:hypothetical protein
MNGYFDESHYNLEKAAEHLLSRPDVVVFRGESQESATNGKEAIYPIPYYNAEEGRQLQIRFRWSPSHEDYAKIVAEIGSSRLALPNLYFEMVYRLDILGLRAAGCALSKTYY